MEDKRNKNFEVLCKNFTVKENTEKNTITIEGWANTTDKDRQGDIILEEAWTKGGLNNYMMNPIVLFQHNPEKPIGELIDYSVNNKGLHVIAEISSAAQEVYTLIKDGVLKAFSVGFRVEEATYEKDDDTFYVSNLEMYELSVVSIPANAQSIFSVRKGFENDRDYETFKNEFTTQPEKVEITQAQTPDIDLDKSLEDNQVVEPVTKEKKIVEDKTFTEEELKAAQVKAVEDALAAIEAKKAKEAEMEAMVLKLGKSGEERLVADFEAKLAEKDAAVGDALEEFRTELKEKNAEIEALMKNKMSFESPVPKDTITLEEMDTAVLAAKSLGKKIEETDFYKALVTKTGAHLGSVSDADGWERTFSTRLYEDIKDKTIIEPLFGNRVQMTSRTMTFPWNPEAGYATWIADSKYRSDLYPATTSGSTDVAEDHEIYDNTLKAEKLASKEYIGYEEEEDAIIALMPMIREAVVRRVVISTDTELLRANIGADSGSGTVASGWGVEGVSTKAADASAYYTQPGAYGDATTIADLQQVRRKMGVWGLMPGDCTYVVSQNVYYDLLEDPDFRTMDVIGDRATILRGQIGMINGSAVLISDSFATDAAGTIQAICLNSSNYLFGELRGMMVERDRDIENQKTILVATRRFAFNQIVPATTGKSACANLVRPAS